MKPYLITIIITGILCSCSVNEMTVYLKAENVEGLTTKSNVTLNGFEIGQVNKIILDRNGQITIKLDLSKEIRFPTDSKFIIEKRDLFGTKQIAVRLGKNNEIISNEDTLIATNEKTIVMSDTLTTKVREVLESLTGKKQKDSILIELRRLNKNLEEQKEK
jgi:ABC-type transporter Mla subunit MlaD